MLKVKIKQFKQIKKNKHLASQLSKIHVLYTNSIKYLI